MQETWVQFPGQEDSLEKEMATHSSILVWEIPWTEEPGRLQSMELQRVRHALVKPKPRNQMDTVISEATSAIALLECLPTCASGRWVTEVVSSAKLYLE